MTRTRAFVIMGIVMTAAVNAGAGIFFVNLEPDTAKRRAVPISYGSYSAELYLRAPEGWTIGHSSITAQDSTLWTGPDENVAGIHLYRMMNAHSSREYLVVYGHLTKGEGGDGYSPWFRATVPAVDIDWQGYTSASDEEKEDDRSLYCPVTDDNSRRRKLIIQNPRDDSSLEDLPILTLAYPMSALTVRRADGTAVASGTALDPRFSVNRTPLTLYADPVAGKNGFRITLKGPSDGTYEPMDAIEGNSIAADLDVDANYNGIITDADDDIEESAGGVAGVGGDLQPIGLKLLPEDLASGTLTLSAGPGGEKIRVWPSDSTNGTPVSLPKNWTVGTDTIPPALYVQGVAASDGPRDVALKLSYTDGLKTVEDAVRLTVVQTDLDVDANCDGAVTDADEPLEESAGGLAAVGGDLCPVSLKLLPEGLASGTLTLSAGPGGEKIRVWPNNSTNGTPVSLPKIWTVGTDTIPETLYVQGLSASGAMRDVKLRLLYKSGALTVCDDNIRLTVLKVETITAATVPSDTTRKKVGVGEDVTLTLQPSSLSLVTWSISGNGTLSATTGNPITFTAHDRASTPNITATYGSGSCSVTFNVVEPDSESATKESEDVFPAGVQGAGMVLLITVNPTDVSFANVEMLEVPGPASNITGYFTNFPASTLFHFPDTEWGSLNAYNQWGDNASFGNFPSPWYAGSFQWNIPVQWRVVGKTSAGTVRNRLQTFSIAGTNGTSTVTKLGKSVTRTP